MKPRIWLRLATCFVVLAGLSGCASVYRVDNQVESFARWSDAGASAQATPTVPAPPQRYRFERLPSQLSGATGQSQDALEQWTHSLLAPLGWTQAEPPEAVRWTVQVAGLSTQSPYAPWENPWERDGFGWMGGIWLGAGNGHAHVMWNPWPMHSMSPYYQRQVSLVIRESATGRVVYETRAAHDGRWNSTPALWQAMLSAALADFPNPPAGVRLVNLDLPR